MVMSVTVDLSDDAVARLRAEARRRGISVAEVVEELAAALPPESAAPPPRTLRFFAVGRSASGRHAVDADEMLAEGFGRD